MNGDYWEAIKKEIAVLLGVVKDSLCGLKNGIAGFLSDNGKEMCVAADIIFIPILCIYLFKSNYYRNNIVDKLFLFIILLINIFFTSIVFYAVAKGKKSNKKSDYATWPSGLSVLWGIIRILCINHGYKIPVWIDIISLLVCILSIPVFVIWRVHKEFKEKNRNNAGNTENIDNS